MEKNLRVTNYSNFKDLSYFVDQHKKALRMMEEVQNFYLSFLKSKLIHSYEISSWPGKLVTKKKVDKVLIFLSKYSVDDHGKDAKNLYGEIKKIYNRTVKYGKEDFSEKALEKRREKAKELIEKAIVGRRISFKFDWVYDIPDDPLVTGKIVEVHSLRDSDWDYGLDDADLMLELDNPVYSYKDNTEFQTKSCHLTAMNSCFSEVIISITGKKCVGREAFRDIYETPDAQQKLKEYLGEKCKKEGIDCWLSENKDGILTFIDYERNLSSYSFEIGHDPESKKSKKEYLIVSKTYSTSGNHYDKWKTFFEKDEHREGMMFDISNGNFVKNFHITTVLERRQLDVHNGWHPYEDD